MTVLESIEWLARDCHTSPTIFFLGAGCSISSGIPGATHLAREWYANLSEGERGKIEGYNENRAAEFYQEIFMERFKGPNDKRLSVSKYMNGPAPGAGYAAFVKFITAVGHRHRERTGKTRFPFVLTVNFDDLLEQAFTLFSPIRPQVIGDPSLADFIRGEYFSIIKLHGDYRFEPISDSKIHQPLDSGLVNKIISQFDSANLVFIGYGGNDKSIADLIEQMKNKINMIYWINNEMPGDRLLHSIEANLEVHQFVPIDEHEERIDFDEYMVNLLSASNQPSPNIHLVSEHIKEHHRFILEYHGYFAAPRRGTLNIDTSDYLMPFLNAAKFLKEETFSVDKAEKVIKKSLDEYRNIPAYLSSYAHFLKDFKNDAAGAEKYYEASLQLDKDHAQGLSGLSLILKERLVCIDEASECNKLQSRIKECFEKVEWLTPSDWNSKLNHAGFLLAIDGKNGGTEARLSRCSDQLFTDSNKLEFEFYSFAHEITDNPKNVLLSIQRRLKEGIRSKHFDLTLNVKQIKSGGKNQSFIAVCELLANLITDRAEYSNEAKTTVENYFKGME